MKLQTFREMIAVALFAALVAPAQLAAEELSNHRHHRYSVVRLGSLGGTMGGASSINNRGWVSGSSNLPEDQTQHAVLWRHGQTLDLGTLGGPNSSVSWPNHNRRTVVGIAETSDLDPLGESWSCSAFFPNSTGHTCLGFVWERGVMRPLPTLGGNNGYAAGANNRGQVVGWAETDFRDPTCIAPQVLQFQAVLWGPRGQVQALPPLEGDLDSAATAINDRGQVVGISGTCYRAVGALSAKHAVLWERGQVIDIGNLGGIAWNTPAAINNRGDVAGFSDLPGDDPDRPNFHAFFWTRRGGIHDLGTLPGDTRSLAFGLNERGQVVGESIGSTGRRAFIWQGGAMMTDLNALVPPGSPRLLYANDINDEGEIVGQAQDSSTGEFFAFVALPGCDEDDDN